MKSQKRKAPKTNPDNGSTAKTNSKTSDPSPKETNMEKLDMTPAVLKTPLTLGGSAAEAMAIRESITLLNNPELELTGVKLTRENAKSNDGTNATPAPRDPIFDSPSVRSKPASPVTPKITSPLTGKFFFTGRLAMGKDHCAAAAGLTIHGFADPLYYLATYFFDKVVTATEGKDLPGMRAFLQTVGQWGRATVTTEYPLTPARATFTTMIRSLAGAGLLDESFCVDWANYGKDEDLWLTAALKKIGNNASGEGVAITNVRFPNEFKRLVSEGWQHWHVMAGSTIWKSRLAAKGIADNAPAIKDLSEKLAGELDNQVIKSISASKTGPKLRVIWNDTTTKCPARLHTLAEFLQTKNTVATIETEATINTGE